MKDQRFRQLVLNVEDRLEKTPRDFGEQHLANVPSLEPRCPLHLHALCPPVLPAHTCQQRMRRKLLSGKEGVGVCCGGIIRCANDDARDRVCKESVQRKVGPWLIMGSHGRWFGERQSCGCSASLSSRLSKKRFATTCRTAPHRNPPLPPSSSPFLEKTLTCFLPAPFTHFIPRKASLEL